MGGRSFAIFCTLVSALTINEQGTQRAFAEPNELARPTLDGNLHDLRIQTQQAPPLRGLIVHQIDKTAGADGFQDDPLGAAATPQGQAMHSPINVGDLILVYSPDTDGVVQPASQDDSWLAIGVNIANGDGDVFDGSFKPLIPPGLPSNIMVAFDADGNGDPGSLGVGDHSRWFPEQPLAGFDESTESIHVGIYLCAIDSHDLLDPPDFEIVLQQVNQSPITLLSSGLDASLVSAFPPADTTIEEIRQRGLDEDVSFPDGLGNDDIEFLIEKIDSQALALFQGDDFETQTRLRLSRLGITLKSEALSDLSEADTILALGQMEVPQIEVSKQARCAGEADDAWGQMIQSTGCETVEIKLEAENAGNMPLLITLTDSLTAFEFVQANIVMNSLAAVLHRPSNAPGIPINPANAAVFNLNPAFFTPTDLGFLGGVQSGQPRLMGQLAPAETCAGIVALPGDRLVLTYRVSVVIPPDFCAFPPQSVDAASEVNAVGARVGAMAEPLVNDRSTIEPDTPREILNGFDDNSITVDVLCPEVVPCPAGEVVFFDPPDGVVDARAPFSPKKPEGAAGIDTIKVRPPTGAESTCWSICESVMGVAPNEIVAIVQEDDVVLLQLMRPVTPGSVLRVTYTDSQDMETTGSFLSHPANVNGDGAASPLDILRLIDCLNEVDVATSCPWGSYSQDIDHSGALTPEDVLRLIDLLSGADGNAPWSGTPLPTEECQP